MNLKYFLIKEGDKKGKKTIYTLKQVVVVRRDIKMSKGKLASQVAHAYASVSAANKSKWTDNWLNQGQKKSILACKDENELLKIFHAAKNAKLPVELIRDAGRTEIPEGTITCVGIGPAPENEIDRITGNLRLL